MAYISEEKKLEILEKATLERTLSQYHSQWRKRGKDLKDDCPICKKKDKLSYSPTKEVVKCFSCDIGARKPVSYLTKFQGRSYKEALEELAKLEMVDLPERKPVAPPKRIEKTSFCAKVLRESGLTQEDITTEVVMDQQTKREVATYQAGTVDERFEIIPGDDMIIHYYDLEGKPMYFYRKDRSNNAVGKRREFYRVRYQNPALHKDKNGNPVKYRSPFGSGSKIYINKVIRRKYQAASIIETLYIQEGEKKADKATKHGLISVGVMGIHNIASNKTLPKEFELIIKRCQVKNVVFAVDADWQDLSSKIDSKHAADQRPTSFFTAVRNFRHHFYAFANNDIHLNIYFAHVSENTEKDKGVDDLLTNSLRGKEGELKDLCEKAIIDPKGDAKWMKFHNITNMSDYKLREFWGLQDKDAFVAKYHDELKELPQFKFRGMKWRINEMGLLELAQPLLDHERFWNKLEKVNSKGDVTSCSYSFNHKRCYSFLSGRGFGRLAQPNNNFMWIQREESIVREVQVYQIRDYVINFTKELNMEEVENMLYRGGPKYFGPDSMGNLEFMDPKFHKSDKGLQYLYFQKNYWKITKDGIEEGELGDLNGDVWQDQLKDFTPSKLPLLLNEVHQINDEDIRNDESLAPFKGEWSIDFSDDGFNCHFLQFLVNTSNFNREGKRSLDKLTIYEKFETTRHLLSKLTTIGYMLHRYRDSGVLKAVICMDIKMSEVGVSNGRTGKSLLGEAMRKIIPTVYIGGKKKDLTDDRFKWEEVDERTELVFIDDLRVNFDFEALFPEITGDFQVEGKGIKKYTLHRSVAPKILISTNHAIKGEGSSFRDRQILLGFSDYYNDHHKPVDDFGKLFFDEWDRDQWNLFYNMAAMCLHLYFKHGLIEAPTEKLEKRRLRQDIGEVFLDWAEEFFSRPGNLRNKDLLKSDMYNGNNPICGESFIMKYPGERKYTHVTKFKRKLKSYCKYMNWEFNPSKNGGDIKKGGAEYIEIYPLDEEYDAIVREHKRKLAENAEKF